MPTRLAAVLSMVLIGAALLLAGAWVMYQEASPILRGGGNAVDRIATLAANPGPFGVSLQAQRSVLMDCEQTMRAARSLEMLYEPEGTMVVATASCEQIAQTIVLHSPANSLAWLVEAQVAITDNDIEGFNTALARSWLVAPNELWLARMRFNQGEAHFDALDANQQTRHLLDLAIVGADDVQVHDMAELYVGNPDFRPRMDQALKLMATKDQRMFLTVVQTLLGQNK